MKNLPRSNLVKATDPLDLCEIHEQLVQPVTFLKVTIELWQQGLSEPQDVELMEGQIEKLVEVVRSMQAVLKVRCV